MNFLMNLFSCKVSKLSFVFNEQVLTSFKVIIGISTVTEVQHMDWATESRRKR